MLIVWIILSLIVGFVCGHLFWTRTKVEEVIKEVIKEVPVEKIVKEEVPIKPVDYDEYLEWKEHKENWIDLANLVADVEIQDDEKFERIIKAIEKELTCTYDGELSRTPRKNKKNKNI